MEKRGGSGEIKNLKGIKQMGMTVVSQSDGQRLFLRSRSVVLEAHLYKTQQSGS